MYKTKLAVLWLFMAVATYRYTSMYDPGVIEKILAGEAAEWQTPEMLLFTAIFWLIPLVMAFLSVTLKDSMNRWTNVILGIVFAVLNIFHFILHLTWGLVVHDLLIGSTVVASALIVWYVYKWPKQEVVTKPEE